MIDRVRYIFSESNNPYHNLALEKFLLEHVGEDEVIVYLWQNDRTIVIGRHQDDERECRAELVEAEGGYMARRLSGGGAVYQDMGNLCYTFLAQHHNYDVRRQTEVILRAMKLLGFDAQMSGRNDLTIDGAKFSGNAYYRSGDQQMQHGTLLMHVDKEAMARYLKPSQKKLASKGVSSVQSRVVNLKDLKPDLGIDEVAAALRQASVDAYGAELEEIVLSEADMEQIATYEAFFANPSWRFRMRMSCTHRLEERYDWGEVQLRFCVDDGAVAEVEVCSDAMFSELLEQVPALLKQCPAQPEALQKALESLICHTSLDEEMKRDVILLVGQFEEQ